VFKTLQFNVTQKVKSHFIVYLNKLHRHHLLYIFLEHELKVIKLKLFIQKCIEMENFLDSEIEIENHRFSPVFSVEKKL
jgi:hypothetical protein